MKRKGFYAKLVTIDGCSKRMYLNEFRPTIETALLRPLTPRYLQDGSKFNPCDTIHSVKRRIYDFTGYESGRVPVYYERFDE